MRPNTPRTLQEKEPNVARAAVAFGIVLASSLVIGLMLWNHEDPEFVAESGQMKMAPAVAEPSSAVVVSAWTAPEEPAGTEAAPGMADPVVLIESDPEPVVPVTYQEAESAYLAGDYELAADLFVRYAADRPNNPWGHYMNGLALRRIDRLEDAEAAFLTCLAIDPDHGKSLINLARVRLDAERAVEAEEVVRRAATLDPESVDAHRVLARALHTQGRRAEALEEYDAALAIDPADPWSLNNRGLILIEEERFDEAAEVLTAACAADATQAVFANNLGVALERTGRFADAEQSYAAALALDAGYDKAAVSLARVEGRENEVSPAAAAPLLAATSADETDDDESAEGNRDDAAPTSEPDGGVVFAVTASGHSTPEEVRTSPASPPAEDRP